MRFALLTVVAAATIGLAAGPASARSLQVPHKPWGTMNTKEKIIVLRKQIHRDQSVLRFWHNHRDLAMLRKSKARKRFLVQVRWARVSLKIATRNLHRLLREQAHTAPSGFPPHHALWQCISGFEGGVHTNTGNGYYGMLQMSYGWLGLITGRASDHSQSEQEWAAETGYKNDNYSTGFLYGQWFKWDGAAGTCLRFA